MPGVVQDPRSAAVGSRLPSARATASRFLRILVALSNCQSNALTLPTDFPLMARQLFYCPKTHSHMLTNARLLICLHQKWQETNTHTHTKNVACTFLIAIDQFWLLENPLISCLPWCCTAQETHNSPSVRTHMGKHPISHTHRVADIHILCAELLSVSSRRPPASTATRY